MAIRWRKSGQLICAAMSNEEEGDTYINDHMHYQLSVISKAIIADVHHETNGLWYWIHTQKSLDRPHSFLRALPVI